MLETLLRSRVLLITGKGGVGKTCVAAAIARAAAARGRKVLLTEVATPGDDYSPLAGLFGLHQFGRVKQQLMPGLHAVILLAQIGHRIFFESVLKSRTLTRAALASKAIQRLLASAPSAREMGLFVHLLSLLEERAADGQFAHDLVVVDMPATGHALAITSLPRILLRIFQRGPIAKSVQAYVSYVHNPAVTKAYVVTIAESLPVSEAVELVAGLQETEISVGGVILNRLSPITFSEAETAALTPLLDDRPVLGRESFFQLAAACEARNRLHDSVSVPVFELPTLAQDNLVVQMERALGGPPLTQS